MSGASMGAAAGPWGAAIGAVGGAVMGVIGSKQQNKAAKAFELAKRNAQDDLIIENRNRATKDYLRNVRLEQLNAQQETEALSEATNDVSKQTTATQATATASAAERGVAGRSVEMLIEDYTFQQSQEVGRLRTNQSMKNAQHTENIGGYQDQFDQRVAAVKPYVPRTQPPVDYFGPIFGVMSTLGNVGMASGAGKPAGSAAAPAAKS